MQDKAGKHRKSVGEQWHYEAVKHSARDAVAVIMALISIFLLMTAYSMVVGSQAHAESIEREAFMVIPEDPEHASEPQPVPATQPEPAVEEAAIFEEVAPVEEVWYDDGYSEPYFVGYSGGTRGNPDGLNSFDGTFEYNGHHETFYASNATYDDQLWVDYDGFYRTDDGHYVVASSDYAEGTEIEISQGKAIVMDDGCESGTVDVHTTWK